MIQAMNTAAVGMRSQQQSLDTIANNLANVETVGYKKDRVNFKDALYVQMRDASNGESTANMQKGTGAIVGSVSKIFTATSIVNTGSPLDAALETEGAFFAAEDRNGTVKYTRDGNFKLSVENDGTYLVNNSGDYILDTNNARIRITALESEISITSKGNITDGEGNSMGILGTYTFSNLSGLEKLGGNCYAQTVNSGAAVPLGDNVTIKQRYLEASNVDMGDEVTNMIKAQRAYQMASRVLTVSDRMEEIANELRR